RREVRRRLVGYVFQRPAENVLPYLTAMDHLTTAARLRTGRPCRSEAHELLDTLGLSTRARHNAGALSSGEQQRLAAGCAVTADPALVVADEPTAELDSAAGASLMELVSELADRGICFAVSTHDPAAIAAADRTLYLRHGALEAESSVHGTVAVVDAAG